MVEEIVPPAAETVTPNKQRVNYSEKLQDKDAVLFDPESETFLLFHRSTKITIPSFFPVSSENRLSLDTVGRSEMVHSSLQRIPTVFGSVYRCKYLLNRPPLCRE